MVLAVRPGDSGGRGRAVTFIVWLERYAPREGAQKEGDGLKASPDELAFHAFRRTFLRASQWERPRAGAGTFDLRARGHGFRLYRTVVQQWASDRGCLRGAELAFERFAKVFAALQEAAR